MKLTLSSLHDDQARQQLERVQEKRLRKLVEFEARGGEYVKPTIQVHGHLLRDNQIVVTNEAHSRSTNPGYSRKGDGGQYAH